MPTPDGLTILAAIEEEEGGWSPPAAELKEIVEADRSSQNSHDFYGEKRRDQCCGNRSPRKAGVKTGVLDLGMSGGENSYASVMDANLEALKAGLK